MKVKFYDRINEKGYVELEVSAKVAHFIENENKKNRRLSNEDFNSLSKKKQEEYSQRQFEQEMTSLDELMSNGFQPSCNSIEQAIEQQQRERKYLSSPEYRNFRKALRNEIRKVFDIMSEQIQKVMYLRFFKDYSLSQIAKALDIAKGTAQEYVAKGCKYIKYFLDKDIKEQDKLEKERRMKIEQSKHQNKKNKNN